MKRAVITTLFLGAIAAPRTARANPPDTYGFGSRETAMGNAAAAETRGFAANYYNPAALVRSRGLEVSVGYFRATHSLAMNGKDSQVDDVHGVVAGLVVPGRLWEVPFAFGVGLHLPDDQLSRVRARKQESPRWELYDARNQRVYFAANLAVEPVPWLEIGGGLSFMSATTARLDITGSANVLKSDDSQLRHEVDADLTAVRYPQFGVRITPAPTIALAAVYRGQFKLDLDVRARLAGDVSGLTTALYELETRSVNAFLPQQFVLGGSWQLLPRLRATLDLTWIDWSAYVAPAAQLTTVLDVPPPAGGFPAGIAAPTAPPRTAVVPLRLHDRVVPHIGVEWQALAHARHAGFVRAGYEAMRTPFAGQSGVTTYVDRDRHTFSLGLGYALAPPPGDAILRGTFSVDAHAQLALLPQATTEKANPADYAGDFTAGGRFFSAGLTATFAFAPPEPK